MNKKSIVGFDYLRAIGCVTVVIWHTDALRIFAYNEISSNLISIFYYNIGLLAVPIFLQISLYLFYQKHRHNPKYFYQRRFSRLLLIYGFWVPFAVLGKIILGELEFTQILFNPKYLLWVIITGGDTLFYFLFSLLFLSLLADLKMKIKEKLKIKERRWTMYEYAFLFLSCLVLIGLSVVAVYTRNPVFVAYNNPINFFPYIFTAFLIEKKSRQEKKLKEEVGAIAIVFLAIIVLAILEWRFLNYPELWTDNELPQYARVSSVLASSVIMYLFIRLNPKPIPLVTLLSFYSLGIYCIHKFLPNFLGIVFSRITPLLGYDLAADIPMMSFLRFWSLLLGSIVLTLIMKRIKFLKQVV